MSEGPVIPVGAKVTVQGKLNLGEGTVKYVGVTKFQTGRWVGIELAVPMGKNDGEVQGVRYFNCPPEHGIFVKPSQVILSDPALAAAAAEQESAPPKKEKAEKSESTVKKTSSSSTSPKTTKKAATGTTTKTKSTTSTTTSSSSTKVAKPSTPPSKLRPSSSSSLRPSSSSSSRQPSPVPPASPTTTSPPGSPSVSKAPSKLAKEETKEDEEDEEMLAGDFPDDDEEEVHEHEEEEEEKEKEKEKEKEPQKKEKVPEIKKEEPVAPKVEVSVPAADSGSRSESVDRMMVQLKELNDFKVKSQETIQKLQKDIAEETNQKNKLVKEHEKELQRIAREHDAELKQLQKQGAKEEKGQQQQQTWDKEKQDLLEQIATLTENLELITLDKEIAEEKAESLESELLAAQTELDSVSSQLLEIEDEKRARLESLNKDGGSGGSSTEECLALMEQNEKLKDALVKLRDFSVSEKQEATKKIKELEKSAKLVPSLTEKVAKMEEDLTIRNQEIDELKQLVDDANAAQDLIDELSDKNLNLTEKVEELTATIGEFEDLRAVSEELEESQDQAMKELRSEIHKKEMELLNREGDLANWQLKCSDQDKTINQFRDLVNKLQRDIAKMKEMAQEENAQINEIVSREKSLMNMNIQLQTQVIRGTAAEVSQQLDRIKASEALLQAQFLRTFIPEKHYQADNDAIRFVLFAKRVSAKTELVKAQLQKTHKIDTILSTFSKPVNSEEETLPTNDVAHSLQVELNLSKLDDIANDISNTLSKADVDLYLKAGKATYEAELLEKSLDGLIALIRDEQFGPNYPVDELEKLVQRFEALKTAHIGTSIVRPGWRSIYSETTSISYLVLLLLTETAKSVLQDSTRKKIVQVFKACRKLLKQVSSNPNLQNSPVVVDSLAATNQLAIKAIDTFKQANTELVDNSLEKSNSILDKYFGSVFTPHGDEEGENAMEKTLHQMDSAIRSIVESILAGDLDAPQQIEKDATDTLPWVVRGQQAQAQLAEVGNLKEKVAFKDTEITELQKQIKVKDVDLQEEKYKVESLDNRIRNSKKNLDELNAKFEQEAEKTTKQEKIYEEALESMRKDYAALEAKNATLQGKLTSLSQDRNQKTASLASFGAALSQVAIGGSVQVANYELEALKSAIRHLHAENARLKAEISQRELTNLLASTNTVQSKVQPNDVVQVGKELSAFVDEIHHKLANVKVVDLVKVKEAAKAKATNKPQKAEASAAPPIPLSNPTVEALQQQQLEMANLQHKGAEMRAKLLSLLGEANTSFAKFPSPITAPALRNLHPVLLGKIEMPQVKPLPYASSTPTQVLFSKPREFEQVHSVFVR